MPGAEGYVYTLYSAFRVSQFSQMRDEMFNSNLVCSFIMLLVLMAAQALIPAPRYDLLPPSSLSIFTLSSYLFLSCSRFRAFPVILQFLIFLLAYTLLLLVALAEEFKWTPVAVQQFCCWIHENTSARNLLTITAIIVNFGLASADMVTF